MDAELGLNACSFETCSTELGLCWHAGIARGTGRTMSVWALSMQQVHVSPRRTPAFLPCGLCGMCSSLGGSCTALDRLCWLRTGCAAAAAEMHGVMVTQLPRCQVRSAVGTTMVIGSARFIQVGGMCRVWVGRWAPAAPTIERCSECAVVA